MKLHLFFKIQVNNDQKKMKLKHDTFSVLSRRVKNFQLWVYEKQKEKIQDININIIVTFCKNFLLICD